MIYKSELFSIDEVSEAFYTDQNKQIPSICVWEFGFLYSVNLNSQTWFYFLTCLVQTSKNKHNCKIQLTQSAD